MEAFLIAKHRVLIQIHDWHQSRFAGTEVSPKNLVRDFFNDGPRVLIVDDDVDMALAMQSALAQLGCQTEVHTCHEGLHRKLASSQADYIFLDWKLNDQVTADQVVERAVRFIDTFSDLREKFAHHRPSIVTHSVLDRGQVTLPKAGIPYFSHLDHWQKPMPFHEVVKRASELITTNAAGLEV